MSDEMSAKPSTVPKGLTIGLAIFAFILGIAGFVVEMVLFGQTFSQILPTVIKVIVVFWLLFPFGFVLGAKIINKYSGKPPIQARNAITLGLLLSCVSMLWLMAGNS